MPTTAIQQPAASAQDSRSPVPAAAGAMDTSAKRSVALEVLGRIAVVALFSVFLVRFAGAYERTGSLRVLLLLIGEAITVLLVVTSRLQRDVDRRPFITVATVCASFYFIVVSLSPGPQLLPSLVTEALQIGGISCQIFAKLWLGRSFGLLPANRGIVTSGPYALVRHPMYLGYFLNHVGFLLSAFSLRNLVVYVILYLLQVIRIHAEERKLLEDAEYKAYAQRVRWRALPFVF
jgi:protein-S-isoprenylcysteine O-methyltransferase Ste14